MKTNKQRAEIILQKANSLSVNDLEPETKKFPLWKIITAIACILVVLIGATIGIVIGVSNNNFNLDKMYIANFDSYKALGAGSINDGNVASASTMPTISANGIQTAYASSNSNKNYLIGQKEDGSLEKIKFSKTKNGKAEKDQKGYITNVHAFQNFTIVEWSKIENPFDKSIDKILRLGYWTKIYVIDNKTGKIFNLVSANDYMQYHISSSFIYGYSSLDGGDCFYLYNELHQNSRTYYKVSVENELLKVEEIVNNNLIDFNKNQTFTDKYGNLFITDATNVTINFMGCAEVKYCISNRNVIDVGQKVFRSANGIVYTEDKSQKFNANGELVENTFDGCDLIVSKDNLIKKVGNTEYYYGVTINEYYINYVPRDYMQNIYKVTWQDEEVFSYEAIPISKYTFNYVSTKDKIYFLDEQNIFSVDIETGNKQELVADYIFNSISTDNLGNVVFNGIRKDNMNHVKGIIYNDGRMDISETNQKYIVYYITALN